MATTIHELLEPINGYLLSMVRDTEKGWYVFEIGIPSTWVFNENKQVACEVLNETKAGKLIRISPKNNKINEDDLVNFVEIIIETNERIAEKEKEFTNSMEAMKADLEKKAKEYYEELDKLKEDSFKKAGDKFVKNISEKTPTTSHLNEGENQPQKPRQKKNLKLKQPKKSNTLCLTKQTSYR